MLRNYSIRAVGWAVILLLGTELFVRLFILSPRLEIPFIGSVSIHGTEGYGIVRSLENYEVMTPYSRSKAKSVLVIGDSFTEARSVMDYQNYVSVAETLARRDGADVDLRNFGKAGLSFALSVYRVSELMQEEKPDLIVFQTNYFDFMYEGFRQRGSFRLIINDQGELELSIRKPNVNNAPVSNRSQTNTKRLEKVIGQMLSPFSIYQLSEHQRAAADADADVNPPDPASQTGNALSAIDPKTVTPLYVDFIEKTVGDIPIIFILLPNNIRVDGDVPSYPKDSKVEALASALSDHPNWHVIYPADPFNQLLADGYSPVGFGNTTPFDGHINVNGHRVLGELLASKILEIFR